MSKEEKKVIKLTPEQEERKREKEKNPTVRVSKEDNPTYQLVKKLYKDDYGEPLELTETQIELFDAIFKKTHHRVHIMTHTQYGKSLIVALAVLTRASTYPEKWCIIAPSNKKAQIIMGYIVQHAFDNPYTKAKLKPAKEESLERLRRERSSKRLTFGVGDRIGEVFILSAEARRKSDVEEALMGFGSPHIVEDESALISDKIHSTAMRMLGGYHDNYLFKIGNPFRRNHFLKSYNDPRYHKIIVDHTKSIAEGRLLADFADEMKEEAFFDILYKCEFPKEDMIDDGGYMPLLSEADVKGAMMGGEHFGRKVTGVDVAESGANSSVIVDRSAGYAEIILNSAKVSTIDLEGHVVRHSKESDSIQTFIDKVGVGSNVYLHIQREGVKVMGVNAGIAPSDKNRFFNKRAEMYWRLREWIKGGGRLSDDPKWLQLLEVKYKSTPKGQAQIQPKLELIREGKDSPDVADALSLTFFTADRNATVNDTERFFYNKMKKKIIKKKGFALKMTP